MQTSDKGGGTDDLPLDPAINVTPFIDVMLVLLIIFMVTAPMMTTGMKVELPRSSALKPPPETRRPVTVNIGEDGELQVDGTAVTRATLTALVRQQLAGEDRPILIRGDRRVPYGTIADTMSALSEAGLGKITLALERASREPLAGPDSK